MIYFPVESVLNSANPSGISRYKIRKNNPLYFQHLRNPLASVHSKGTSTSADSTLTRPLSLTPLQSTLTENRGRGAGVALVSKNSRNFASLFHSLCQERKTSPIFPIVCALFAKKTGVYPNCSLPRRLSARGQNGTAAILPRFYEPRLTPMINGTPLTLSTRFSSLPLHAFSPSFGGRRVD